MFFRARRPIQKAHPPSAVAVRQPLLSFSVSPAVGSLVVDLRNMLAQRYIPLNTANGQRLLIVQSPKAILGGVSITFWRSRIPYGRALIRLAVAARPF